MWNAILILLSGDDFANLAADKDPDRRVQAIESLRPPKDPVAVRALLPLLADEHPKVRWRALRALIEGGPALVRDPLIKTGLRSSSPLLRQGACEVLGELRDRDALPELVERLHDPDPRVRGAATSALGLIGDPSSAPPLIAAFRMDHDWPLRAAAIESLARLSPESLPELLPEASTDSHYQVRLVAAELAPTAALAGDRDWRVRAAAVEGCLKTRDRDAVDLLVEQFGKETGRLRWDCFRALQDLTGKDLALDAGHWRSWWQANRATFEVRPAGARGLPAIAGTQAAFFEIPILSNRMIFVLDLSGSMREPSPKGGTKLDVAKTGMTATLRSLGTDVRFGILGLGCDADGKFTKREEKTWQRRLALYPASPPARADAERFVRGLEARGWTNLYDGLEAAMNDPDADTIFLYSDGGASKGTFVASGEILAQLRRLNRFRKIVIHTVEVPGEKNPEDNRRLLEKIAASTKGTSRLASGK